MIGITFMRGSANWINDRLEMCGGINIRLVSYQ